MLPDIQHAIRLQILDDKAGALTKEIAALPKHIAEIEKKLESHIRQLDHDKAALAANQKDRKRLEGDIQTHDQKISKLKSQMMEAKTNEQYRAFQQEIDIVDGEKSQARERTAEDQKQIDALKAERSGIIAAMSPAVASNYERIRKGRGVAVSEVSAGRCSRCNMTLRPQFFQDLKKADKIMTCESCGRILYYNPPQAVEDLGGRRVNMSAGMGVDADA